MGWWESEVGFAEYSAIFEKARALEKAGRPNEALALYIDILRRFRPCGSLYFERPAIVLEREGRFDEALAVCDRALADPDFRSRDEFTKRRERLLRKIEKQRTTPSKTSLVLPMPPSTPPPPRPESPDELVKRLRAWRDNPASQPDIEKWYNEVYKAGAYEGGRTVRTPECQPPNRKKSAAAQSGGGGCLLTVVAAVITIVAFLVF